MTDWSAIDEELDHWQHPINLWWRDDDAIGPNPQLDQLVELSQDFSIDLFLAVIPAKMQSSLPDWLIQQSQTWVLQHGISHENHAQADQRKIELGGSQESSMICAQLIEYKTKLSDAFADRFLPILVPPWNRIESRIIDALPDQAYSYLSVLGAANQQSRLSELNVHIDIIDWQQRSFKGSKAVLDDFFNQLSSRRQQPARQHEPIGLMTHHWIHDAETNSFLGDFFSACSQRSKINWLSANNLLQQ